MSGAAPGSDAPHAAVPRSYLFVPANRPERFDKACAAGADAVIIDLEDAVPAADKDQARSALMAWLRPEQPVLVRINSAGSDWFAADLALCRRPGVAGIVLPKAERPEDIAALLAAGATSVLALIETAYGFANMAALATADGVRRLLFGSIDFKLELGIDGERDALLFFRSQMVLLSKLAHIQAPVDGVTTSIDDAALVADDTHYARRLGMGGKLCIHPKQVAAVNQAFQPSADDVLWAGRVLAAAAAANGAAVALDGKMVDRPVILKARQIAAEAARRPPA